MIQGPGSVDPSSPPLGRGLLLGICTIPYSLSSLSAAPGLGIQQDHGMRSYAGLGSNDHLNFIIRFCSRIFAELLHYIAKFVQVTRFTAPAHTNEAICNAYVSTQA